MAPTAAAVSCAAGGGATGTGSASTESDGRLVAFDMALIDTEGVMGKLLQDSVAHELARRLRWINYDRARYNGYQAARAAWDLSRFPRRVDQNQ